MRGRKHDTSVIEIDRSLYDCDDCVSEAIMDVGVIDSTTHIPLSELKRFNKCYKAEYKGAHIRDNLPVRKPR